MLFSVPPSRSKRITLLSSFPQPRAGEEERLLRADLPEAAQRASIDPDRAFGQAARVEKGVGGVGKGDFRAVETGTGAGRLTKGQGCEIVHRQRIDRPAGQRSPVEQNRTDDAGAFAADRLAVIDPAGVFHQDVELHPGPVPCSAISA